MTICASAPKPTSKSRLGVKKIRGEVLLRRARVNEIGFEFVSMDLDSRYRLRRVLVEALQKVPDNRSANWDGER
jgi:hypothetical protein